MTNHQCSKSQCFTHHFCGMTNYISGSCSTYITDFSAPQSKKRSMLIADWLQATSFFLEESCRKWADHHFSFITEGCIYHIIKCVNSTFQHVSGLKWNIMEVSAILCKCTYCIYSLYGSHAFSYSYLLPFNRAQHHTCRDSTYF